MASAPVSAADGRESLPADQQRFAARRQDVDVAAVTHDPLDQPACCVEDVFAVVDDDQRLTRRHRRDDALVGIPDGTQPDPQPGGERRRHRRLVGSARQLNEPATIPTVTGQPMSRLDRQTCLARSADAEQRRHPLLAHG